MYANHCLQCSTIGFKTGCGHQQQTGARRLKWGTTVGTSELPVPQLTVLNGDLILGKILYTKSHAYMASSELPCDASWLPCTVLPPADSVWTCWLISMGRHGGRARKNRNSSGSHLCEGSEKQMLGKQYREMFSLYISHLLKIRLSPWGLQNPPQT